MRRRHNGPSHFIGRTPSETLRIVGDVGPRWPSVFFHRAGAFFQGAGPDSVAIGTLAYTATVQQDFISLMNSGRVQFRLLANEKQGSYTVTSTNNGHTATLTVNQRKK